MRYLYSFTRRKLQRFSHVGWIGISLAIAAICLTVGRGQEVQRQARPAPASEAATKSAVAIIDVQRIFDNHKGFQRRRHDLDDSVASSEAKIDRQKGVVEQLKADRAKLVQGSPEWNKLDHDVLRKQVDLLARIQQDRKRFLEREFRDLVALYKDIVHEADNYIANTQIDLVLHYNESNREVMNRTCEGCGITFPTHMSRSIVTFKKHVDITQEILQRLNAKEDARSGRQTEKGPIER